MEYPLFDQVKNDNKRIKILIVDDKTDNIEVAASVLAPDGFTLLFAQSGYECLEIAETEHPDIILLDIMMPMMDGLETCRRLKDNIATAYIAVIFLTAKIDDETLRTSFEIGGCDYIPKPFSATTLLSRVYNQLRIIHKQEALTQVQERLAKSEKNQLLGLLAGGIAHDFNNQLNGIIGFSDLIKDKTADEDIIRLAELITECGERCAVLTNNLLAFAGKGKYQLTAINLYNLVKSFEKSLLEKFTHICCVIRNTAKSPVISGDLNQISNVINAVFTNAIEAMNKQQEGELTCEISDWVGWESDSGDKVVKTAHKEYIQIKISDTGVGISQENISRVFEPFFTTKDLSSGGGMSLAAAYGIVENHGGDIFLTSKEGVGTEVTILFPKCFERGEDELDDAGVADAKEGEEYILIIDDNKMNRILLEDIVSLESYNVITAKSGEDGLELFKKYMDRIHLVFLDYIMPNMSGPEVLARMMELNPAATVYIISGYKSEASIKELLAQGAKGFIQKPFKCREIIEIL